MTDTKEHIIVDMEAQGAIASDPYLRAVVADMLELAHADDSMQYRRLLLMALGYAYGEGTIRGIEIALKAEAGA